MDEKIILDNKELLVAKRRNGDTLIMNKVTEEWTVLRNGGEETCLSFWVDALGLISPETIEKLEEKNIFNFIDTKEEEVMLLALKTPNCYTFFYAKIIVDDATLTTNLYNSVYDLENMVKENIKRTNEKIINIYRVIHKYDAEGKCEELLNVFMYQL